MDIVARTGRQHCGSHINSAIEGIGAGTLIDRYAMIVGVPRPVIKIERLRQRCRECAIKFRSRRQTGAAPRVNAESM